MSKQTAVEWLVEQYTQGNYGWEVYEQAKQMEKEQIMDAWSNGFDEDDRATSNPFKYYNETFKQ